jgi:hypothetical protein
LKEASTDYADVVIGRTGRDQLVHAEIGIISASA